MELDKSGLDNRVFNAFAETSGHLYIYLCNMQTNVSRWSRFAVEYFGLLGEYMENAGVIWEEHIHPEDRLMYHNDIEAVFSGKKTAYDLEYRARNKEGDYVVCTCHGIVLKGKDGEPDLFVGTIVNHGIIDNVDPATNLYNIYEFMNAMRQLCENKEKADVLMLGINQFHNINDVYGYVFGNKVLCDFGEKLKELVCGKGMVYRMDGAKFAICVRGTDKPEDAARIYERIRQIAHSEIVAAGTPVSLSVAGGAICVNNYSGGAYTIRSSVTYALDQSKQDCHGELVFFEDGLLEGSQKNMERLNAFRQSMANGCSGFYMCYQPLVEAKSGRLKGMEALVRWKDEVWGEVPPGCFIPWLEQDPFFYELGKWILKTAMTETLPIVKAHPDFILNINISHSQFERSTFRDSLMEILRTTGFPAGNLCLELTERCRAANKGKLKEESMFFHAHGIRLAMDDFGTGAASLNLLREVPMDCLKIDRAFISNIQTNHSDQVIVETVIDCAGRLGIHICLEGVENQELRDFVMRYDADTHQGYYYSRPVRIEKFAELL